ncbi:MAG: TRAP transporter large permease [Methylocystis sp.]|nr:TRAP transporter large permease [Methylocystis sp.]MCA3583020.1 TRAP transporter large permease [Methylocystis sp.]MCA3590425.1 TRAP transporter large permease [Methylocystis sp.]
MTGFSTAIFGFAVMLLLIGLRAPIGLSMLLVGAAGYMHLSSGHAFFAYMKTNSYHQFANYTLSVIPLFILMGALAERAGIAASLFKAAERGLGRFRGGLAMSVIGACTAFGAICGSSVATTATFGRAALPELLRARYDGGLATGTIAVGGTLGILIPPSVILVVYAITTEQNIAKLFQAALIPGLLAAFFYCLTIAWVVKRNPELAPFSEATPAAAPAAQPWWPKALAALILIGVGVQFMRGAIDGFLASVGIGLAILMAALDVSVMPAITIAVVVVGGIYGGVFTPTEGAAVGAITMLAVGVASGKLGWRDILDALRQTAETSGMIFIILLGAEVFGAFLALSRLPAQAAEMIGTSGLSPYLILISMLGFYILLGAVMDELAMILLTLPVFFPIIQALDFGMSADDAAVWFGILVLIVVGIGLTAPPIGLNVFVISSLARQIPIAETYRGVLPFLAADVIRLALVVLFPGLALWLVRLLA